MYEGVDGVYRIDNNGLNVENKTLKKNMKNWSKISKKLNVKNRE